MHCKFQLIFLQMAKQHNTMSIKDHVEYELNFTLNVIFLSHLFDIGNVSNESIIIHKLQEALQLAQVADIVLSNSLIINTRQGLSVNTDLNFTVFLS